VVVAGLGDTGLLTAIHLAPHLDVVAIGVQPSHVSAQELGLRITRPDYWARDYWIGFDRYRRLRSARTLQGELVGADLRSRHVTVRRPDGSTRREAYDVLVIATGVRNGFWRQPRIRTDAEVAAELHATHCRLASAGSVVVVGGGAAAVSSAANIALAWPGKRVDLHYPGERPLPRHHPRVWRTVEPRMRERGVGLHPGHRAAVPEGFACDRITSGPVSWQTGQSPVTADAVLWAIGRVRPNTGWLPREILDDCGFVRVGADLAVPGHDGVFAVGDVAATDPLRSSARNRADRLLARNVRAWLAGRPLGGYRPPRHRWGSVLGAQPDGLTVFGPTGHAFRFPVWWVDRVLQPWIVHRGIYGGIRRR
jgi:NADH dehydrogenase FAD-containing subunit